MKLALKEELRSLNTEIDEKGTYFKQVLEYYIMYFVLNMAEMGTSPDTVYPSENFELKPVTMKSGDEPKTFILKMNLITCIDRIQDLSENRVDLGDLTLRSFMRPFADIAKKQLQKRGVDGILARKYPRVCRGAKHMGFDFNQDLQSSELSNSEMRVKQNLGRVMFNRGLKVANLEESSSIDFE